MNQLTFVDKIQVLCKLLFSSPVIIGIFAFSMILMILLFFYSKLNKKIMKFIFIFIYVLVIGFAVVKYGNYFLSSIDSFVTLFMANIYFPVLPFYVAIMFISFVIMIFTLNSKSQHRVVKIINTVFFTLIQMLFALFIYIVESNNIDLSVNTNLYTNEQTLTLLELGMGLFVVWIFVLLIIFYLKKADKIFKVKNVDDNDDFDEYINDYNEPVKSTVSINADTGFNNGIVEGLVPEIKGYSGVDDEIIDLTDVSPDVDNTDFVSANNETLNNVSSDNSSIGSSSMNIFNNFEFLDFPVSDVERKNDDIEIIDFDD